MISRLLIRSEAARFVLAGAVNTLFGLAVYTVVLWLGLPIWAALLVGGMAGIVFNFVSLGGYAFRDLSAARLPRFVMCYGACYLVNLLMLEEVSRRGLSAFWGQVLLTPPMAIISYLLMSRLVFTGRKRASGG